MNKQKNEAILGVVNQSIENTPKLAEKLQEKGISRVADNQDMRSLSRVLSVTPAIANEYYTDLFNKIGTQIITASYDNSGFKNTLDLFTTITSPVGDTLEIYDTALIATGGIDYGSDTENGENNPFKASKSRNFVHQLKIKSTIHTAIEKQMDVISEAFISTQALDGFIARLVKTLQDSVTSKIWNEARDDLLSGVTKEIKTGAVLDMTDEADVKKLYTQITKTCLDMVQESKDFNEGVEIKGTVTPKLNATPLEKQVVLLNSTAISTFNVNIIASLVNSNKLLGEKFQIVGLPFTKANGTTPVDVNALAFIIDKGRFIMSTKMNEVSTIYNPKGPSQVYHLNRKMFWGHIPYFNAVKVVNKV